MAMTSCDECGHQVSTKAEACPSCGARQAPRSFSLASALTLAAVAGVIVLLILSWLAPDSPAGAGQQPGPTVSVPPARPAIAEVTNAAAQSTVDAAITTYAQEHGETRAQLAERLNTPMHQIENLAVAGERSGIPAANMLKSLDGFATAMKDPEKVRLVECLGVRVYKDPQPPGHPPSAAECEEIKRNVLAKAEAERSVVPPPAATAPTTQPAGIAALSEAEFEAQFRCPETYATDQESQQALAEMVEWYAAHHAAVIVSDLVDYRMKLLTMHQCLETLANIASKAGQR